jgi:hypothetical protein
MEEECKFSIFEIVGLVVIALVILYFPYKMIIEHGQDAIANGYYHDGR